MASAVNIFHIVISWHLLAGSNLAEGCGFCVYCFMVMFHYESFTFPSMGGWWWRNVTTLRSLQMAMQHRLFVYFEHTFQLSFNWPFLIKFFLYQAMVVQRGSRGIAPLSGERHLPAVLTPGRKPGTQCARSWVGPGAGMDLSAEDKVCCFHWGSNPELPKL
jgi:hypothetical protein